MTIPKRFTKTQLGLLCFWILILSVWVCAMADFIINPFTGKPDFISPGSGGSSFTAALSDGLSGTQLIGTGVWKSTGSITFTASYGNGPPVGSTVTYSGWGSLSVPMTNNFNGPTSSTANVNYPSLASSVAFLLSAIKANGATATSTVTHTFYNNVYYGVSTTASGYSSSDVTGLSGTSIQNTRVITFTVNAGAGQYIIFASPTRLGTATFTVNSFEGGFNPPETVSVTNSAGYTENYYVYRSFNSNLATTTVNVT